MVSLIKYVLDLYHSVKSHPKKEEHPEPEGGCQLFEKYQPEEGTKSEFSVTYQDPNKILINGKIKF